MTRRLATNEVRHWSRVQAEVLNRFNWPAKRKANIRFAVELASEIADLATAEYAKRTRKQP